MDSSLSLSSFRHSLIMAFVFSRFLLLTLSIQTQTASASAVEGIYDPFSSIYARQTVTSNSSGHGDYTCSSDLPCTNGACCGESGWCGYGPTYCGDGCQSNCNATAECGEYAAEVGQTCPLNVCCSQWGFCGTTTEFCNGECQSYCAQPEPSAATSNVQTRIVGYWETWNNEHTCGMMNPSQIPVNLLSHLNIAFGYINSAFQVINMDGVSPDIYSSVGNIKSRNPSIKIIIAIGGWAFNDPGAYRETFTTMVSTEANRATFIQNLLGFLSQYGYDGVDFDWEYPGADDRGGTTEDGVNYTALLKELRAAITASGKDYIMTFTAPTSYWYLRHFDIENMSKYADWINLMAYDLHGVWDSSDPIGNQVLAHTNLTEIDLALDLFWRAGVEPSAIVLGLGFYGRSFTLEDPSCWQPGCAFSGAGEAGPCTDTAGILSYREIMQILSDTGAKSYLDTTDAVRYLVYNGNSWISYDDSTTFQMKIDYANSKGLSGLMVWAVDLDGAGQPALHAISNSNELGAVDMPFELVDLKYLFPTEDIPPSDVTPMYGLVNIGSAADAGNMDPTVGGFGFFLVAGESYAVAKLRKREGEPEPFTFLDCPENPLGQVRNGTQTARVVCLSEDVEGCFRVMERGVEGTIIDMPDNCAPNTFARAISLVRSDNQSLPRDILSSKRPTSAVFDFAFDYDMEKLRRDSSQISIRLDYSNVDGYWNSIVDSPGIQSRSLKERFFAPTATDWETLLSQVDGTDYDYPGGSSKIQADVSAPLFWQAVDDCEIDGDDYGEGFGAYVQGNVDVTFSYGFSLVATVAGGQFLPQQASGFLSASGTTDLTYTIGGVGAVDISQMNHNNPAFSSGPIVPVGDDTVTAGNSMSWVELTPYYAIVYQMATMNGTDTGPAPDNEAGASFDGLMSTRIITNLGGTNAYFPATDVGEAYSENGEHIPNQIEISDNNILYDTKGQGGQIAIGTYLYLGLNVQMQSVNYLAKSVFSEALPNMTLVTNTMTTFSFYPGSSDTDVNSCANYDVITNIFQTAANTDSVGWDQEENEDISLIYDRQGPSDGAVCYKNAASSASKRKRDAKVVTDETPKFGELPSEQYTNDTTNTPEISNELLLRNYESNLAIRQVDGGGVPGWYFAAGAAVTAAKIFQNQDVTSLFQQKSEFKCQNCLKCEFDEEEDSNTCLCGCKSMNYVWGYSDIPPCDDCDCVGDPADPSGGNCDDGTWPGTLIAGSTRRAVTLAPALPFELGTKDAIVVPERPSSLSLDDYEPSTPETPTKPSNLSVSVQDDAESDLHWLMPRVFGTATITTKKVTVCGAKIGGTYSRYPAFPADASFPWDNIDNGAWNAVGAYYGNSSSLCTNWAVSNNNGQADTEYVLRGQKVRTKYQTEHVFEGQLIGDFFSKWLNTGKVNNQNPDPGTTIPIIDCAWTKQFITSAPPGSTFTVGGVVKPFIQVLMAELGGVNHLDRLTIFVSRPNRKKGSMFTGNQPTSPAAFTRMSAEEKLLSAKDLGMIFNYLNTAAVWDAFCGTYEAVYDLMGEFDTWYSTHGTIAVPTLQSQWRTFVRTTLDSMVLRSRATYDTMAIEGALQANIINAWATAQWGYNTAVNRPSIELRRTCNNMDPSNA